MDSTNQERQPQPVVRFTFDYEGTAVRLLGRQTLNMIIPPSDSLEDIAGQAGFWYELRDASGRPIYRRIVRNPIQVHIEVHTEDAATPTRRIVDAPQGVFTVLVPDLSAAETLALCSSPFTKAYGPVEDLATFPMKS